MKFNPALKKQIEHYKDYVVLVEGKKESTALVRFGFNRVFEVHKTSVSMKERIEQITSLLNKKDKICILTGFDKKGKKLYLLIKSLFQEKNIKLDSTLRGILIKSGVTHVDKISELIKKLENF